MDKLNSKDASVLIHTTKIKCMGRTRTHQTDLDERCTAPCLGRSKNSAGGRGAIPRSLRSRGAPPPITLRRLLLLVGVGAKRSSCGSVLTERQQFSWFLSLVRMRKYTWCQNKQESRRWRRIMQSEGYFTHKIVPSANPLLRNPYQGTP